MTSDDSSSMIFESGCCSPTLSILVPVYNTKSFLKQCLESVLSQTFVDYECILVNDGSTDGSEVILEDYAGNDNRFRVIYQDNEGLSASRKAGLRMARGKFVTFLDSDDWIEPDMYERLMTPLCRNRRLDVSIGGYLIDNCKMCFERDTYRELSAIEAWRLMMEGEIFNWSLCDKIYRRKLFDNDYILDNWPNSYGEDTFVNWNVFKSVKMTVYTPTYGYHYRIHSDSMTRQTFSEKQLIYIDLRRQILEEALVKEDLRLIQATYRQMRSDGLRLMHFMYEKGELYCKKMVKYSIMLLECAKKAGYHFSEYDSFWLNALSKGKTKSRISMDRKKALYELAKHTSSLWIYGAGVIGQETAAWMNECGVNYKGFMVTQRKIGERSLCGHPIKTCAEIFLQDREQLGIVFAMNNFHFKEALAWVRYCSKDEVAYINDGQYNNKY